MSSNLKNKLSSFEAEPPVQAWDKIAAALEAPPTSFSDKLFQYELAPPPSAWSRIEEALDVPQLPARTSATRPLVRWLAAAAIIGAVLFSTTLLLNKQTSQTGNIATSQPASTSSIIALPSDSASTAQTDAAPQEATTSTYAAENTDSRGKEYSRPRTYRQPPIATAALQEASPGWERAERRQSIDFNIPTDRYLIYSDGTSAPVKLSKKMFDIFSCAQEDISCRDRIKAAQFKLANAALASDFSGMLDLLNELKENQ
jgi:hypothetical protein